MNTKLAVIMPVKNRLNLTKQTIESLVKNTDIEFELFMVADACEREVVDYLKTLPHKLIVCDIPVGVGKARNLGMHAAGKRDFYYHTDCDMYFLPYALDELLETYMLFPEMGILGGRKHPHHGEQERIYKYGKEIIISDQQVGMSMFYSCEIWSHINSFKENAPSPDTMGQEDTDFCIRVSDLGYKIGSVNPPVVLHCGIKNTFNNLTAGHNEELQQPFPEGVIYE